jgi:hypothetical protein
MLRNVHITPRQHPHVLSHHSLHLQLPLPVLTLLLILSPVIFMPHLLSSQHIPFPPPTFNTNPLFDPAPLLAEMAVDVIEALIPRRISLLLELDNLDAEAAPELSLAILSNAAGFDLRFNSMPVSKTVLENEVRFEVFGAGEEVAAGIVVGVGGVVSGGGWGGGGGGRKRGRWDWRVRRRRGCGRELATVGFELEVLAILMPLPIRFRAEALVAVGIRAAVGASVAFQMFPHVAGAADDKVALFALLAVAGGEGACAATRGVRGCWGLGLTGRGELRGVLRCRGYVGNSWGLDDGL